MILVDRTILSCETETSDKVYIIELFSDPDKSAKWSVVASWGRRTAENLTSQVKTDSVLRYMANTVFNRLKKSKLRSGYVEVKDYELSSFSIPGYSREDTCTNVSITAKTANVEVLKDVTKPKEERALL